jgi:hypothetical protein
MAVSFFHQFLEPFMFCGTIVASMMDDPVNLHKSVVFFVHVEYRLVWKILMLQVIFLAPHVHEHGNTPFWLCTRGPISVQPEETL